MIFQRENETGFTLIEMVLAMSLFITVSALSVPVLNSILNRNQAHLTAVKIAQSLRRAQILAQASSSDSPWGVQVLGTDVTIFKGNNYATRDPNFDQLIDFPQTVTVSGNTQVIFQKFSGFPVNPSSIQVSSPEETKALEVNAKGIVSY